MAEKNIVSKKNNLLLKREEIVVIISSNVTPSKKDVVKMLSEEFKKPEENIVIEKIKSKFGIKNFEVHAKIYNSIKDKQKYETTTKKERKALAEESKKTSEANKEGK
ncbi:MAG: hypothetical protein WC533_02045 [Candidatus Pacearchaeota archaeon]